MGLATLLSFPYLQKMVGGSDFFNGFRYAVAGYMFEYCLHGNVTIEGLIINYTVFMAFGEVTCMIFGGLSPVFTKTVGSKRMAFFWSALLCLVLSIAFFFIPMSSDYIWVMIALVILTSIGIGIYSPLMWSMYADVADYHTEHFGTSATGLIFSSGTMYRYLWFTHRPFLGLGWSQYDNRQDGKYSHRSYFHHRLCAYDGLVALLSLPCCYCLLADGIVV